MLLQTASNLFMAQCLARIDLRKALVDFCHEPRIVVDQTLNRFHDKCRSIAALLRRKTRESIFEISTEGYFH